MTCIGIQPLSLKLIHLKNSTHVFPKNEPQVHPEHLTLRSLGQKDKVPSHPEAFPLRLRHCFGAGFLFFGTFLAGIWWHKTLYGGHDMDPWEKLPSSEVERKRPGKEAVWRGGFLGSVYECSEICCEGRRGSSSGDPFDERRGWFLVQIEIYITIASGWRQFISVA